MESEHAMILPRAYYLYIFSEPVPPARRDAGGSGEVSRHRTVVEGIRGTNAAGVLQTTERSILL